MCLAIRAFTVTRRTGANSRSPETGQARHSRGSSSEAAASLARIGLRCLGTDDLAYYFARYAKLAADRLDRLTMNKIGATDLRNRRHHQHPNRGFHHLFEAAAALAAEGIDPKQMFVGRKQYALIRWTGASATAAQLAKTKLASYEATSLETLDSILRLYSITTQLKGEGTRRTKDSNGN